MIYDVIYSLLVLIGVFQQTVVRVYYILNYKEIVNFVSKMVYLSNAKKGQKACSFFSISHFWSNFFFQGFGKVLKAHRQISKKRCFEKYCSCDQACQFSALCGTPWRSYLRQHDNWRQVYKQTSSTFYTSNKCREEKLLVRRNKVVKYLSNHMV